MSTAIDWQSLYISETAAAKGALFDLLQGASLAIQTEGQDSPALFELVPRIADVMAVRGDLESFREIFSSFARALGLWNYIDREDGAPQDRLIAEMAVAEGLNGVTFHRGQVAALNVLLSGKNLILSAPTSFGKSLLIDALLATKRYKRVAIVVPTIALLDEFRRRIRARFNRAYALVMHGTDVAPEGRNVVYLGTQERLIGRSDLIDLDLVIVDEFYKLDEARDDERSSILNAAVYKMLHQAKQFFFLGPNIASVTQSKEDGWNFEFLHTRYSTVAVNTFDLHHVADKPQRLLTEALDDSNWPALVFVSSPQKANEIASWIVARGVVIGDGHALADWMAENFGPEWELVNTVRAGIGVHHAKVPRSLASRFVKLFNDRSLPLLLCTSTLIEGVNTAAKSVLIFDKQINRKDYDFFTFSNIRGRAGRLGEHHIGKVYLFHEAPDASVTDVAPPLFSDVDFVRDEFLVHMDERVEGVGVGQRIHRIASGLGVPIDDLRRFSALGFDQLGRIKEMVHSRLEDDDLLVWRGRAAYDNLVALAEIACAVKRPVGDLGVFSAPQLAFLINRLRSSPLIKDFFRSHFSNAQGAKFQENIFRFLRACEHTLPEIFGAVEMFTRARKGARVDYSLLLAELASWFRPAAVKHLEEQGIPVQISERFFVDGDSVDDLADRLRGIATFDPAELSNVERQWILDALPG